MASPVDVLLPFTQSHLTSDRQSPFPQSENIVPASPSHPRKRVLLYSLIIACLTIFAFVINLVANLLHDLLKNDQMWEYLSKKKCKEVNITC